MPFACFLGKTVIFVAFTLLSAKMYVMFNAAHVWALSIGFCSQLSPSALYIAFLTAILMVLLSIVMFCIYHVFWWHLKFIPRYGKYCKYQILLALVKTTCNVLRQSKCLKCSIIFFLKLHTCNYDMMSLSGHLVCWLGLIWCILLGIYLFSSIS